MCRQFIGAFRHQLIVPEMLERQLKKPKKPPVTWVLVAQVL